MVFDTIQTQIVAFDEQANKYMHLLLKRSSEVRPYPNLWQVVTGRIESGELALNTALREVKEETGLDAIKVWNVPYIASFFVPRTNKIGFSPVFAFLVDFKQNVIISSEHSEFVWVDYDDIKKYSLLPSHNEACRILKEYILDSEEQDIFIISEDLWRK